MDKTEPLIRNISDTARWVAVYRARETARKDALFQDPFAQRLAGERGEQIAASMQFADRHTWPWVARTYLFDRFVREQVEQGVDMVVNLAAGLDSRPYRMALPASLRWIEVDLPEILAYKEEILDGEKPACGLERIRLDLSNVGARRELFERLGRQANKALIITEGLLVYLTAEEAASLATDLAQTPSFQRWAFEVVSPGLLRRLQKSKGQELSQAGAALKFAPPEGPEFFTRYGWKPVEVHSLFKTASQLKRLPFPLRLFALLPEPKGPAGSRPWSGVCLFARQ